MAESGLVSAWYRGAWWLWLLRPLELVFRLIAWLRRILYEGNILTRYQAPKPLVIVGNITVGGTGKTPVVLAVIEHLQSQGLRPGLVSRGYGATSGQFPHRVSSDSTAADCGDEALLIYRRTQCPCVVSPVRPEAVKALVEDCEVDVIVSDDGLQHYALARDLEVAVLDHSRGTGNGFCLPAGPLREPRSRLDTVDFLLYRGSEDPENGVNYQASSLVNLVTGEEREPSPDSLQREIHAIAGIGQPEQFFTSLRDRGFQPEPRVFADHHLYQASDFSGLGEKPVLMTEKDAVKCASLAGDDAWYLKIEAVLPPQLLSVITALARGSGET